MLKQDPVYVSVILAAAGSGSRMQAGINKQLLRLGDKPVLAHTVAVFERHVAVSEIVIVAAAGDMKAITAMKQQHRWRKTNLILRGGASRQDSVRTGLLALAPRYRQAKNRRIVLVHDGARCLVDAATIDRVLAGIRKYGACGAAIFVKDTIKEASADGKVLRTLERGRLWAMQTPQGAFFEDLLAAHEKIARDQVQVTDDLAALEASGHAVHLVQGDETNLKLTTPFDLDLAKLILSRRDAPNAER